MAIYHFSAKVISRGAGRSAVAAAAYRSGSELHDERLDRTHDYSDKPDVVFSEVMLPEGAPAAWGDRGVLWNAVEAGEKRKDAQLAREVEFALPREMTPAQACDLARDFVQREFVDRGMVADLNVHWDRAADGSAKPHAHVMLTLREAGPEGFGKKVRDWNARSALTGWRERWAEHVNARLAELGIDARIDHRSLKDQGLDLEPQHKVGPAGQRRAERGEDAERADEHRAIARRNGERLWAEPELALTALTRQQSTFTERDLQTFVFRHTDGAEQFRDVLAKVQASPEMLRLGQDGRGRERFTTREMLAVEARLEQAADELAAHKGHGVAARGGIKPAAAERRAIQLGSDQRDALDHVTAKGDLSLVIGYAGTGKSAMLGVAREAWERSGYTVRGAALSGIAAEALEGGSGISSRTIASLEHAWGQGREALTTRDVLVIDEAGMVGSRQLERVLSQARDAGAKVVLVGDPEQLQAIEAGAAFRALAQRHGAVEITEVRRQREAWQQQATRELATGRTDDALARYEAAGMVQAHGSTEAARAAVVEAWRGVRAQAPETRQIMLAYTNEDVRELNARARETVRAADGLGEDVAVSTERGRRLFAVGDRIMFLRNERSLGVKNGTLATLEGVSEGRLEARLDDGRAVGFDLKDYAHVDHGYAATIHKAQGVTVDRAHVLASGHMDRHAAYVSLTRHREGLTLHYAADAFGRREDLVQALGRARPKDTTLDYTRAFAERREIHVPAGVVPRRGMFAGLKLGAERSAAGLGGAVTPALTLEQATERYAEAWRAADRMGQGGRSVLPHQRAALERASVALDAVRPHGGRDLEAALRREPGLEGAALLAAMDRAGRNVGREAQDLQQPVTRVRGRDSGLER